MIITHAQMKAYGYCNRGARPFFERHGLDWADFVANGIDEDLLRATEDAMAIALVEHIKEKVGGEQ